jgi:uncharacterized membrane protein
MIETSEDQTNFEHTVVTLFRRDVLIVASSFVGGVVAYMNGSEDDKRQDMIKRANDALDDAKHELSNFHFHTVCLISKSFILTVIVEMLKNNVTKHLGLRLKSVAADGLSRLSFGFSKELGDLLLGKSTHEVQPNVVFYECEPAIAKNWGKQP